MATVTSRPGSRDARRLRHLARALGLTAAVIGMVVLGGWALDIGRLKGVLPGLVTMKANTALGMLLCGLGLALLSRTRVAKQDRYMTAAMAIAAFALAALTLAEYVAGWDLGIDEWMFSDATGRAGTSHPGRMSPVSTLCFVFAAAALLVAAQRGFTRLRHPIVAGLGASVMATGVLALLGYVLESRFDYRLWNYTGTALHSAAGFILLGAGLLSLVRSQGRLRWSLEPAITAAFAVAILLMVLATGNSYDVATRFQETARWVVHSEKVLVGLERVATDIATLESNQRGYAITGDERFLQLIGRAKARVTRDSAAVRALVADNSDQQRRLDRLEPLLAQSLELSDRAIAARRQSGLDGAQPVMVAMTDAALTHRLGRLLEDMREAENVLLDRRQEQAGSASVTNLLLLPLGMLLSLTTMLLGLFLLNAGVEQRSRAEQASSESEARLAGIIHSAMDAVVSVDRERRITLFNGAAEKMFRSPASEAIGQRIDNFTPERLREPLRQHLEGFEGSSVMSRSIGTLGTLHGLRADGCEFPIEAAISLVEVSGEKIFTAIIRDISDRERGENALRQSEEQLRLAVDATQLGTWDLNVVTGERRWSDRSKALFAFPAGANVDAPMIGARIHPDDAPRLDALMAQVLGSDGGDELDVDFRISRIEDDEERWIQSRGRALFEEGRAVRMIGTMLDITDRKRAEQALRASEGRYRTLFERAPDGIVLADRESYYTSANPSICRMLGYSPEELTGMHATDIVVQSEVGNIAVALSTIHSGSDHHREWQFRRKDGSVFAADVMATMMPDGGLMGMIRDITERKQAEAALRDSEQRFRTMANSILQLAWIARADGYIFWYNERWFEYTGAAPEQMEGWGWQGVHDPQILPAVMEGWNAAIDAGRPFEMEFPLRSADGTFRSFLTRAQPLKDAEGRVVQWFGTSTDVQALKEVEERGHQLNVELERRVAERTAQLEAAVTELSHSRAELKSLFESLPGLYLVLTPELEVVAVSDAYLSATLTTREGILGRHLFEVFPDNPDDPDNRAVATMQSSIDRVIRERTPDTMAIQKHDVRGTDGVFEERYWSPINSPVFGLDRKIKYIVHRVEEVTDFMRQKAQDSAAFTGSSAEMQQMEAEIFRSSQKLQAANLQLRAANTELEAFSYSVSHDLRAPLRAVDGYIRILQEDCSDRLDEEGQRLLGVVSAEARRMGELIDDLLEFSRLSREPMARSAVDMCKLARAVFDKLTVATENAPSFELEPLLPAQGDLTMLRQVFVNLIGNAIKFSRDRSAAVIEVGCVGGPEPLPPLSAVESTDRGGAADRSEITYYVKDNGAGFDPDYTHKLFGVFQRLHSEDEFEGTGVGLALVQRIVQRHGGRVWAEGKKGEGATFYFTLPTRREQSG